jgi:hypothetical protein
METKIPGEIVGHENVPIARWALIDHRLVFAFPQCKREHYHGLPEGHRVSHRDISWASRGYFLKIVPTGQV